MCTIFASGFTPAISFARGEWARKLYEWAVSGRPPMGSWSGASMQERQHALFVMGMQRAALSPPGGMARNLCELSMQWHEARLALKRADEDIPTDVRRVMNE